MKTELHLPQKLSNLGEFSVLYSRHFYNNLFVRVAGYIYARFDVDYMHISHEKVDLECLF